MELIANPLQSQSAYNQLKMEGNQPYQSLDRLLTFLNNIGFNFSNDKGMLEHCREGKNLLKVVAEVIKNFQPGILRNTLVTSCHEICEDLDRHRQSLPVITDFLVALEVFRMTGFEFKLTTDFIHPGKEKDSGTNRTQAVLSHLYSLWQWNRQIQNSNNTVLGRIKILQKEDRSITEKLNELDAELERVQKNKIMERPAYNQKMKEITHFREELANIRTRKAELVAQKATKEKESINKIKEVEQCIYRIQGLDIDLANARKELSINAPQVRKEKLRQDAALQNALNRQQRINLYIIRLRELMDNRFSCLEANLHRIDNLSSLEVLESRSQHNKAISKKLSQDEHQTKQALRKLEDEINNHEKEINNQDKKQQSELTLIADYKDKKARMIEGLEVKKEESKKLTEGVNSLILILRNVRSDLQQRERAESDATQASLQEARRMEREVAEWRRRVATCLETTHQPFNLELFQETDSPQRI